MARYAEYVRLKRHPYVRGYFEVMTTIPTATAASEAVTETMASVPAALASIGLPSRRASAHRAAPKIAKEKAIAIPTPATSDAATDSSSASVSTIDAIASTAHPAGTGAPRRTRRAKTSDTKAAASAATTTGPAAPVPKIRVIP
jgi:hypothetical protein